MYSVSIYNRALKSYDPELFAHRDENGIISVLRKGVRWQAFEVDETEVAFLIPSPHFIFALTENWAKNGKPAHWSPDLVLRRLKEIDAWARQDLIDQLEAEEAKLDESRQRGFRNETEAFWLDQRKTFAKATDGILTHSMNKKYSKRRLKGA